MGAAVHTIHVILAGVWLGGVVFTTVVVSPALKAMKWAEAERVGVRAVIGRRYAKVGTPNLALLAVFAVLDGALGGFGTVFYVEYGLLAVLFGLVAAHGVYFGRRLVQLAEAEKTAVSGEDASSLAARRRGLQRLSFGASMVNVAVSVAVVAVAVNA